MSRVEEGTGPIVLLDACVLVPMTLRELLMMSAKRGLFRPRWTARIEDEIRRAILRREDAPPEAVLEGELAIARAEFPAAVVSGWEAIEGDLRLPDWNDRHVLAAAIAAEADILLTDNHRDFPSRTLAGKGIERQGGDAFLWQLVGEAPFEMCQVARDFSGMATMTEDQALRHFKKARLPRFAKALREYVG
ncbi:MAG: PIN domain-containing protein [Pseudomonadota bacterium]